ncbi:MAG: hypothetical protein ACE37F_33715 [Nannocystaceae bacterium]|nr:hypothetical protein [bacterium]
MEPQFQTSFERNLLPEQRRAVLRALSDKVPQDATVGDLVDAARALGWSEPMGALTLQDFANALLGAAKEPEPATAEVKREPEAPAPAKPARKKPVGKKPTKATMASSNAALESLKARLDADEPMSLEEAAEVLVPIVSNMETATMQQLEEFTGIGRRKLRFHIGQLVRHEYLERHGMGRGTYYTACD